VIGALCLVETEPSWVMRQAPLIILLVYVAMGACTHFTRPRHSCWCSYLHAFTRVFDKAAVRADTTQAKVKSELKQRRVCCVHWFGYTRDTFGCALAVVVVDVVDALDVVASVDALRAADPNEDTRCTTLPGGPAASVCCVDAGFEAGALGIDLRS
jgi:hypothetical protein